MAADFKVGDIVELVDTRGTEQRYQGSIGIVIESPPWRRHEDDMYDVNWISGANGVNSGQWFKWRFKKITEVEQHGRA